MSINEWSVGFLWHSRFLKFTQFFFFFMPRFIVIVKIPASTLFSTFSTENCSLVVLFTSVCSSTSSTPASPKAWEKTPASHKAWEVQNWCQANFLGFITSQEWPLTLRIWTRWIFLFGLFWRQGLVLCLIKIWIPSVGPFLGNGQKYRSKRCGPSLKTFQSAFDYVSKPRAGILNLLDFFIPNSIAYLLIVILSFYLLFE